MTVRPLKLPSKPARARAESKALWNEARSPVTVDFYTAGYEGRSTADLIGALLSAGVRSVIDIRHNPMSMYRPELSKGNFQALLARSGLEYVHVRDWGVPREVCAKAVETGTRDGIWEWYDKRVVAPFFERNLHRFMNLEHPVALVCMECDPPECHRHRLFLALERHGLQGYDL